MTFWLRRCTEQSRSPSGNDVPVAVAENLHLDVPGMLDEFFEEDAALLEIIVGQPADRGERRGELRRLAAERMPMPPPPAVLFSITG